MLAQSRCGAGYFSRRARKMVRDAGDIDGAVPGVLDGLEHAARPQIGVFVDLIDGIGDAAGNLSVFQDPDNLGGGVLTCPFFNERNSLGMVVDLGDQVVEARIGCQLRMFDNFGQIAPLPRRDGYDGYLAVGGLEESVKRHAVFGIHDLGRSASQHLCGLIHNGRHRLVNHRPVIVGVEHILHGKIDELAFAGLHPVDQGHADGQRGVTAADQVAPVIGGRHEVFQVVPEVSGSGLGNDVEGGPLRIDARGSEAGNGDINNIRPDFPDVFISQVAVFHGSRDEVVHENVGGGRQTPDDLLSFWLFPVQSQAVFVAVED